MANKTPRSNKRSSKAATSELLERAARANRESEEVRQTTRRLLGRTTKVGPEQPKRRKEI
jgi:hypothetical protein